MIGMVVMTQNSAEFCYHFLRRCSNAGYEAGRSRYVVDSNQSRKLGQGKDWKGERKQIFVRSAVMAGQRNIGCYVDIGSIEARSSSYLDASTNSPAYRRHPPQSQFLHVKRGNPYEVCAGSRSTARETEFFRGNERTQEANVSSRKARGIHNSLNSDRPKR